jgi:hypothetical protein
MSDLHKELCGCLALQEEIAAKQDQLKRRYKAIIESERAKGNDGPVSVIIDGEIWILQRDDPSEVTEEIETARKLGGLWGCRLVRIGRPVSSNAAR